MSQARIDDILDRLTSRKFGLCLLMIVLALIGFWSGHLTFEQLMTASITAAGVYSATNAVETIATRPAAPTVTVEAAPGPLLPVGRFSAEQLAQIMGDLEKRMRATPAEPDSVLMSTGPDSRTWVSAGMGGVPRGVESVATAVGPPIDLRDSRASAGSIWLPPDGPPVPSHPSGPSSADAAGSQPVASVPLVRGG